MMFIRTYGFRSAEERRSERIIAFGFTAIAAFGLGSSGLIFFFFNQPAGLMGVIVWAVLGVFGFRELFTDGFNRRWNRLMIAILILVFVGLLMLMAGIDWVWQKSDRQNLF